MAKELSERNELNSNDKWKLSDIYNDDNAWKKDYENVEKLLSELEEYKGKLGQSGQKLLEVLNLLMEANEIVSRLYAYAHMKSDVDTRDQNYQALFKKAQHIRNKLDNKTSYINPAILELSKEKIEEYIDETPGLELYEHYLDDIIRRKEHYLSSSEEKLLSMANDITQGPENIFSMLNNADLEFPLIRDEEDEEVRLTHGRYIKFLQSKNRRVRKDAFKALYETYDDFINTYAATLNSEIKTHVFRAEARDYNSSLEAALSEDNISTEVYNNLIDTVHDNLDPMYKYIELRKEILDLDQIHFYDIYTPLVQELDIDIPFEEAKKTVKKGLEPLGSDYIKRLESGFDSGWIDIYENKGKRSGAYSSGCYGVHPYVLLNYSDNISDMFTLAHEMGHALHTYYSNKNQPFVYANYKIFVAEVASTLNEALLIHYLLENTADKKRRKYLINHYLDQFKGTVYRQTMFAEFEKMIHEKVKRGIPLTAELLNKTYHKLNEKYFGPQMVIDSEIDREWARIPHFYYNYYVYKYATGFSAATALSQKIIENGEDAVSRYLDFLKSGNSDYPLAVLKKAGVNMTKPQPVQTALDIFADLVDELDELTD